MSKEVNIMFALSFKDINDPRYKDLGEIVTQGSMWEDNNIVYMGAFDSREEMIGAIDLFCGEQEDG